MTTLYANPYAYDAKGFYFETLDEYKAQYEKHLPVEEYEIDYIDGDDGELFAALKVGPADLELWEEIELLEPHEKAALFYLVDILLLSAKDAFDRIDEPYIYGGSAIEYVESLVDETWEVPAHLINYIDYEAILRDMEAEGSICSFDFAGSNWVVGNHGAC